jgi:hypothetical protein
MQIFKQELEDGLSHALSSSASISYASAVSPSKDHNFHNIKDIKSLASLNDSDLYYVQSILVSSSWNKNDDIFDRAEVWKARNTPEDKPTNLEHDEATIIGHITSNWPITEDGELISESMDINDLPEKYHILTGSVIYKGFSNPDLKNRSDKLIAEIEDGSKYVSMECFFKGFDYGLVNNSNGEYKILARNEATAYLTKFLRAYGGQGEHDNYKIGRVLRDITFSGKGFVNKPANPDSIIFTKNMFSETEEKKSTEKFHDLSIAGVFDNQSNLNVENNIMNLENIQAEFAELKTKIEAMTSSSAEVVSQLKDKVAALETEIQTKEQTIAELKSAQEVLAAKKEEATIRDEEMLAKEDEEKKKTKSDLEAALETIAGYRAKEEEMMKKEKKMKRASALMENGLDADSANATADRFESMDDETFAAMTSLFAGKMPPWLEKIKKGDEEEDKKEKAVKKDKETEEEDATMIKRKASEKETSEDTVNASVLETAEVEAGVNLGVGGESNSGLESTRAALVEFVSSRLGKKH